MPKLKKPSNRAKPAQQPTPLHAARELNPGADFGIDRVKLRVPLGANYDPGRGWDEIFTSEKGWDRKGRFWFIKDLIVAPWNLFVHMEVYAENMGAGTAYVEFNPAQACAGPTWSLCPLEPLLEQILPAVWKATLRWVTPTVLMTEAPVVRLDVARNIYEVDDAGLLLQGLAPLKRNWARRNTLERNASTGVPETLYVGTTAAGRVVLYDKTAELRADSSGRDIPDGLMRAEVQARVGWLEKYGSIRTAADLTVEKVGILFANRTEWAQLERLIVSQDDAVRLLMRHKRATQDRNLTYQMMMKALDYMALMEEGAVPKVHRNTLGTLNKILRTMGIAPMPHDARNASARRLDLTAGVEIHADATDIVRLEPRRSRAPRRNASGLSAGHLRAVDQQS